MISKFINHYIPTPPVLAVAVPGEPQCLCVAAIVIDFFCTQQFSS